MNIIILALAVVLSPAGLCAQYDFSGDDFIRQANNTAALQDATYMPRQAPRVIAKTSAQRYIEAAGQDLDEHARRHMEVLRHYTKRGTQGGEITKLEAIASLRGLSLLCSGKDSVVVSTRVLEEAPQPLMDAMRYGADDEVRGEAALSLGFFLLGKNDTYNDLSDALAQTVLNSDEDFMVRRLAAVALAGSGSAYSVEKLAECARRLSSSQNFLSRGLSQFRYEDDKSVLSLEAAIIRVLAESVDAKDENSQAALNHLWYFSGVKDYNRTCSTALTVVRLPEGDLNIDETLLINSRLALAARGFFASRHLIQCLVPIISGGEAKGKGNSCKLRRKAADLYWQYSGPVISATGSFVPGHPDCNALKTNEVMWSITQIVAKEFIGCGVGVLAKTAISATSMGFKVFKMIKRGDFGERPVSGPARFGTGRIGEYQYFMERVREGNKWVKDISKVDVTTQAP